MKILEQYRIKGNTIKNRVVMPPMVCFNFTDEEGYVNERNIKHYEERAKGGVGLIIVEATCIDKVGKLADKQLGIWSDDHIKGLSKIADACHKYDAKALIQIHHAGLSTPSTVNKLPISASDYDKNGKRAREISLEEISEIQEGYAEAAVRAEKAGFDGIELHGAHGYLISQFASPIINKRTDAYGGDLENRMKFAVEIIKRIKEKVNENFIIGYRMGCNEPTYSEGIEIAKILEQSGVDLLHVSAGISEGTLPEAPKDFPYNWIVYGGTEIKRNVDIPVIVVNGIRTPEKAEFLVENNLTDFVAVGKALLANPEWVNDAKDNKEASFCQECKRCMWYTDGSRCPGLALSNNR